MILDRRRVPGGSSSSSAQILALLENISFLAGAERESRLTNACWKALRALVQNFVRT